MSDGDINNEDEEFEEMLEVNQIPIDLLPKSPESPYYKDNINY
jgi:hypothetical protein